MPAPTRPCADLTWLTEHWRQYAPVGLVGFSSWAPTTEQTVDFADFGVSN